MAINESVTGNNSVAITGTASAGERTVGVKGIGDAVGVQGRGKTWHGVEGISDSTIGGFGVYGANTAGGTGVVGESNGWIAVGGFASSNSRGAAIYGEHKGAQAGVWGNNISDIDPGPGVVGTSKGSTGVVGEGSVGVIGKSNGGTGIYAESMSQNALRATSRGGGHPALIVNHLGLGQLISGWSSGREVFTVDNNGNVTVAGGIATQNSITTEGDVYARGVRLTSDKNAKENFSSVNTLQILGKLASMPIQSWNYKEDPSSVRHIGPTAQDFQATFGLNGDDDIHISSLDLQGVALASIQGLNEKLKAENAQLHTNLANLEARLSALESKG